MAEGGFEECEQGVEVDVDEIGSPGVAARDTLTCLSLPRFYRIVPCECMELTKSLARAYVPFGLWKDRQGRLASSVTDSLLICVKSELSFLSMYIV
jgi:hypothetical protein